MSPAPAPHPESPAPEPLLELLRSLEDKGVRWSLLRPRRSLTDVEGDVDLLVDPGSLDRAASLLVAAGFVLIPIPGPDLHGALFDRRRCRFVWVHVQTALRMASAEIAAEPVLAKARLDGDVRMPDDDWLLWILLLRALVDKGTLPDRHRGPLQVLAQGWGGGPEPLLATARSNGLDPDRAVAAAAAGDWSMLLSQARHRPPPRRSLSHRLAGRARRLLRLPDAVRRRGISVAVIGPDGAGKSSLVASLDRDLPLPTRVQYLGLTGGKMPRADSLRVPGLVFAARVALHWLRYLRGLRMVLAGGIAIFDRYTLDGTVPPGFTPSPLVALSRRAQVRSVPLPDLVLLLDAPGETLHARSGEYDAATLEAWRGEFAKLEHRFDRVVKLDASREPDAVRCEAEDVVWRRYGALRGRRVKA